jgi:transcriptional regulator with XRE-family HTH domain
MYFPYLGKNDENRENGAMAAIKKSSTGELLRYWRRVRRYSQMDLSLECDTSSRHLSCVETGRAYPSRQLLLRICNVLEIPLRARNTILIAGGYAPFYQETGLSDPEMKEARVVLERILTLHEPYPAMLVDRCWDIVLCNTAFKRLVKAFANNYAVLENRQWNLMKLLFHADGWAPNVVNLPSVYTTMMERGRRNLVAGDSNHELTALLEEIVELRPREHEIWQSEQLGGDAQPKLIMPVHYRKGEREVKLFTTVATLGAPLNITLQELTIESAYPVDDAGEAFFRSLGENPEAVP